jgi:anthranilate phosphoribosyltransferase
MIIKGDEGNPEVFDDFKYWVKNEDEIIEQSITLESLGINYSQTYEKITLEQNIELLKNPSDELFSLAQLNAAILLVIAKRFDTVHEAYTHIKG